MDRPGANINIPGVPENADLQPTLFGVERFAWLRISMADGVWTSVTGAGPGGDLT